MSEHPPPDGGPADESDPADSEAASPARTPAQQALDLLVFAPAGLVATAIEDLPELAAKGRERMETQLRNAHLIGRLVVTLGQRDLQQRIERARTRTVETTATPSGGPATPPAPPVPPRRPPARRPGPLADPTGETPPGAPLSLHRDPAPVTPPGPPSPGPALRPHTPPVTPAAPAPASAPGSDVSSDAVDAAISGYDTLSASQVVRRLDGLGAEELEAVVRHETATRGRRTILHRAQQLLGTEELPGPGAGGGAP